MALQKNAIPHICRRPWSTPKYVTDEIVDSQKRIRGLRSLVEIPLSVSTSSKVAATRSRCYDSVWPIKEFAKIAMPLHL